MRVGAGIMKEFEVGNLITFGQYYYDSKKVKKPLKWIILDWDENEIYLITRDIIDYAPLDLQTIMLDHKEEDRLNLWENCQFYLETLPHMVEEILSEEEKKALLSPITLLTKEEYENYRYILNEKPLSISPYAYAFKDGELCYWLRSIYKWHEDGYLANDMQYVECNEDSYQYKVKSERFEAKIGIRLVCKIDIHSDQYKCVPMNKGKLEYSYGTIEGEYQIYKDHELEIEDFMGEVVIHYKNGDLYEGRIEYGNKIGIGKYTYQDGSYYIGRWYRNTPYGQGAYHTLSKTIYEGIFSCFHEEGKELFEGRITFVDGSILEGKLTSCHLYYNFSQEEVEAGKYAEDAIFDDLSYEQVKKLIL